jgi:hypothetical protein
MSCKVSFKLRPLHPREEVTIAVKEEPGCVPEVVWEFRGREKY